MKKPTVRQILAAGPARQHLDRGDVTCLACVANALDRHGLFSVERERDRFPGLHDELQRMFALLCLEAGR